MMSYEEKFEIVDGTCDAGDITVYALSTCGFCKRALAFLKDNSVRFRYLYVDDLPAELKDELKSILYDKFHEQVRYPFLVINDEKCLIGFTEDEWKIKLGIS